MNLYKIRFDNEPAENYKIEFMNDDKKVKLLTGKANDTDYPSVVITDSKCRSGRLRVTCVDPKPMVDKHKNKKFRLHRHKLVDYQNKTDFCNSLGVATYYFRKQDYNGKDEIKVALENLCIRRSSDNLRNVEKMWLSQKIDQFDPFSLGYGELKKKMDLNSVRLCCQAIFNDNKESEILVSNEINNCKAVIQVHKWKDTIEAKVTGGDTFCVFLSELKQVQRDVYAVFFDENGSPFSQIDIDYLHSNRALSLTVPAYKNIHITMTIRCFFRLAVKNQVYTSVPLYFNYAPKYCYCTMQAVGNSISSWSSDDRTSELFSGKISDSELMSLLDNIDYEAL